MYCQKARTTKKHENADNDDIKRSIFFHFLQN
jgi:hypothetical protein